MQSVKALQERYLIFLNEWNDISSQLQSIDTQLRDKYYLLRDTKLELYEVFESIVEGIKPEFNKANDWYSDYIVDEILNWEIPTN